MCMQCYVNPYYFYDIMPGWTLIRARRAYGLPNDDDGHMKLGDWGLLQSNDPSVVWSPTPQNVPYWYNSYELRNDAFEEYYTFNPDDAQNNNVPEEFRDALDWLDPVASYSLVKSAIGLGFELDKENFCQWLWDYLGYYINNNDPVVESDAFPSMNAVNEHNENIGWK